MVVEQCLLLNVVHFSYRLIRITSVSQCRNSDWHRGHHWKFLTRSL